MEKDYLEPREPWNNYTLILPWANNFLFITSMQPKKGGKKKQISAPKNTLAPDKKNSKKPSPKCRLRK